MHHRVLRAVTATPFTAGTTLPRTTVPAALRVLALCACVVTLLGTTACGSLAVALGIRQRLDKVPVTDVQGSLVTGQGTPVAGLVPGQKAYLVLVATASDGRQYITVGPVHGKVSFDNYKIDAQLVSVSAKGVVRLPSDPRLSEGAHPHLTVTPVAHPQVVSQLDIPVRYDIPFRGGFLRTSGRQWSRWS